MAAFRCLVQKPSGSESDDQLRPDGGDIGKGVVVIVHGEACFVASLKEFQRQCRAAV